MFKWILACFFLIAASHAKAQSVYKKDLVGTWHLQMIVAKGDTIFNAKDKNVFRKYYLKDLAKHNIMPRADTYRVIALRTAEGLQESILKTKFEYHKDGSVTYNFGAEESTQGQYFIDDKQKLVVKWDIAGAPENWDVTVKNGWMTQINRAHPEETTYFKKVGK